MGKRKTQPSETVLAMRRRSRDEIVAALRDGRRQRSWRIENARAEASRRACRGRHA